MIFAVAQLPEHIIPLQKYGLILSVDGSVEGVEGYDHHKTGEKINLDAMPLFIDKIPDVIITTFIDTDAISSAVAVYYGGAGNLSEKNVRIFKSASYYCDYLEGNPEFQDVDKEGLGLHFYLKNKEVEYFKGYNINQYNSPMDKRSNLFSKLCNILIKAIDNKKNLPSDLRYLTELDRMKEVAKGSIRHVDNLVTVIETEEYLDPMATYQVINTPFQVILRTYEIYNRYSIGVKPSFYGKYLVPPVLNYLNSIETGWGGRNVAGGSPYTGSYLPLEKVIEAFHKCY